MGETSFLMCTDPEGEPAFRAVPDGWRIDPSDLGAIRETLRIASYWLRREWRPDFTRKHPFGQNRHLVVRRCGDQIAIHGIAPDDDAESAYELEFHYVELPRLRSSIEHYVRQWRRRSVTTIQGDDPHGPTEVHTDR